MDLRKLIEPVIDLVGIPLVGLEFARTQSCPEENSRGIRGDGAFYLELNWLALLILGVEALGVWPVLVVLC